MGMTLEELKKQAAANKNEVSCDPCLFKRETRVIPRLPGMELPPGPEVYPQTIGKQKPDSHLGGVED